MLATGFWPQDSSLSLAASRLPFHVSKRVHGQAGSKRRRRRQATCEAAPRSAGFSQAPGRSKSASTPGLACRPPLSPSLRVAGAAIAPRCSASAHPASADSGGSREGPGSDACVRACVRAFAGAGLEGGRVRVRAGCGLAEPGPARATRREGAAAWTPVGLWTRYGAEGRGPWAALLLAPGGRGRRRPGGGCWVIRPCSPPGPGRFAGSLLSPSGTPRVPGARPQRAPGRRPPP